MSHVVEIDAIAEREAREAFEWYRARDPDIADRFEGAFRQTVTKIGAAPLRFPPHAHSTRRAVVERFPWVVVFLVRAESIRILAVAHMRRRPGYWRGRR